MAPAATTAHLETPNGQQVKPVVENTNAQDKNVFSYHSASTKEAIDDEGRYAAHNYHPLPVVFSKASGVSVWDPEGLYPILVVKIA